jgi:hypothetical protein
MLKILKASIHNLFYENKPELNFKPKSNKEMTGKNSQSFVTAAIPKILNM